jgi:hypothetical protein
MFLLEGYKSWSGTFAWTTTGSTKTTTYTYTVIRQDDTTFNFDTVVEKEMSLRRIRQNSWKPRRLWVPSTPKCSNL